MLIIAETAFSHEGNSEYLEELVENLVQTEVDAIKFQILLSPEYAKGHAAADTVGTMVFKKDFWRRLVEKIKNANKAAFLLPLDLSALDWILEEDLADYIEVHSVNLFRADFLGKIKDTVAVPPVVLAVSGYSEKDLDFIVPQYQTIGLSSLQLMFGFQAFPTQVEKLGLARIRVLRERYGLAVGYADHTAFNQSASHLHGAAQGLGANMLEKHVVVEKGEKRIDYDAAVGVAEIDYYCREVRELENALECDSLDPQEAEEIHYGNRRLRLVALKPINAGEVIGARNAGYRWCDWESSDDPEPNFRYWGVPAKCDYLVGEVISKV